MPVTSAVAALRGTGLNSVGDFLRAVISGERESADVVVVAVGADGAIAADETLDQCLGYLAADVVSAAHLTGKAGQVAKAVARVGETLIRVVFLGTGDASPAALRRAGGELGRMIRPGEDAVTDAVAGLPAQSVLAFAEGILLGSYRYSQRSADEGTPAKDSAVRLLLRDTDAWAPQAVSTAAVMASAVALARDLTNTPSVLKSPQWLADVATEVAGQAGLSIRVRAVSELGRAGFGGIVAVGSGSARPPVLIELGYRPPDDPHGEQAGARRHVVLAGKGITFDSGGLSLKTNDGMKLMKTDMAGGAAVIAVMSSLARLGVTDRVTGLIAAAENMPSGSAYRPGDVLRQYGGRTVEVRNTDAEGRLVLADAMAYADAELDPDQIIDLATLTGAARIALGGIRAALYASRDDLADSLIAAGEASGDRLWRMPLPGDYLSALDSSVADLANVSAGDEGAGSITAALFLREFTGNRPWAHLDIAGPARASSDDGDQTAGATGFGTRLLLYWLSGLNWLTGLC
jgi:leucyl aminopeptidase